MILVLFASCDSGIDGDSSKRPYTVKEEISYQGIRGNVYDANTSEILSARIVICDENGKVVESYYDHLPGIFTEEDGSFRKELPPGIYKLSFYHGPLHKSLSTDIDIQEGRGINLEVYMQPWVDLEARGWVNGDGHSHLYTDVEKNAEMLKTVRQICLAQGVDFICTNQGWAGYNDSTWTEGYRKFSDDRFHLHYGSEMPKYRTGHTWWLGQESTRGYFWRTMDANYEEKYYQSPTVAEWIFEDLKFPYIPSIEIVQRIKEADNAVAIMPHPTSWWWQDRGDITKYTTNVASYLSFGLLAGKIWDGMVVMGYDHDHYIYQQLWFHVLNLGYRMPALAELDGGYGQNNRFYYGSMRSYFHIEGEFSMDKVVDAVRRGETFVTSGPIILANIDREYRIGAIIPTGNKTHRMNLEAWASGDSEDYISYVIVFRNGEIFKLWDLRSEKLRRFNKSIDITEKEQAWYVIKVYGKNGWDDPAFLDVLGVSESLLYDSITPVKVGPHDVAITSPFYFRPCENKEPGALVSDIELKVVSEDSSISEDVVIDILINGKKTNNVKIVNGKARFNMPVHGLLKIHYGDSRIIYRDLFFDYIPHLQLIWNIASGRWMEDFSPEVPFSAGEVPWEAFHYSETKKLLENPKWEIVLKPNERDSLWGEFERLFNN